MKKMQGFPFGLQFGQGHGLRSTSLGSMLGGCCHWDLPLFLCTARPSSHQGRFCSHLSRSSHLVLVRERKSARIRQRPTTVISLQSPPFAFHLQAIGDRRKGDRNLPPNKEQKELWTSWQGDFCSAQRLLIAPENAAGKKHSK